MTTPLDIESLRVRDVVVGSDGEVFQVITVHPPYGRRGSRVTVLRESDGIAFLLDGETLRRGGFCKRD